MAAAGYRAGAFGASHPDLETTRFGSGQALSQCMLRYAHSGRCSVRFILLFDVLFPFAWRVGVLA